MNYLSVNKLSVVPIYVQLKDSIRTAILDGTLSNMTELPREEEVCSLININRLSVRRAYKDLIDEGMIRRIKGKSPYVFKNIRFRLPIRKLPDVEDIIAKNHRIKRQLIVSELISDSTSTLHKFIGDTYHITLLTVAGRIPVYREDVFLPYDIFSNLERHDLTQKSMINLIEEDYGKHISEIKNYGKQRDVNLIDEKLFMIENNSVAMFVESNIFNDLSERIAVIETLYPGEYFEFASEFSL